MRRGDGGDDGDVRAHDERQRGEFARMVHPHFEHTEIGGRWHTREAQRHADMIVVAFDRAVRLAGTEAIERSEEHTSELQSLMRISYAVFCLKKKKTAMI